MNSSDFTYDRESNPTVSWLVLSYNCNSECKYCYAKVYKNKSYINDLVLQNAFKIFSFCNIQKVILIGGEPTLYPDIFNLLNKLKNDSRQATIVTNGIKLSDINFTKELKKQGATEINLSFESNPIQKQRIKALKNIRDVFEESTSVILTISKQNMHQLIDKVKEIENIGIKNLAINFALPTVSNYHECNKYTSTPINVSKTFINLYKYIKNKTKIKPTFYLNLPFCLFPKQFIKDIFLNGDAISGCHIITGQGLVIDHEGKILPCTHWVDVSDTNIVKDWEKLNCKERFNKYWNSGSPIDTSLKLSQYPNSLCINCSFWGKLCWGGCPLLWLYYKPSVFIKGFI